MSTFLNGVIVLIISLSLLSVFSYIPMPMIAAILVNTAIRMVPAPDIKILWRRDKEKFAILVAVWLVCLLTDGAMGLIFGMVVSVLRNATLVNKDFLILYRFKTSGSPIKVD